MPRTKASKADDRTPMEKFLSLDNKIDKAIFFNYYDGHRTNGAVGFNVTEGPDGSAKHWKGTIFEIAMTSSKFRTKGKRLAQIAKAFIAEDKVPPLASKPHFELEEIDALKEARRDKRTLLQKLTDAAKNDTDWFIFFTYYDGYLTNGNIGFHPRFPPGSVNHKRAWARTLVNVSDEKFRSSGQLLGSLAKEFVEKGEQPPENQRPTVQRNGAPMGMHAAAANAGYGTWL